MGALVVEGMDRLALPDQNEVLDADLRLDRRPFGDLADLEWLPRCPGRAPGVAVDDVAEGIDDVGADERASARTR